MTTTMTQSEQNLLEAFAGESQANRRYLAFAAQADKEGHKQVARLFRAAAEAETIHAHNHLRALGQIKTTLENLKEAVSGETYEFTSMYPRMIEEATTEANKTALRSFTLANGVEKIHAELYQKALDGLEKGQDAPEQDYWVCPICGYTHEGEPPDECPICRAMKKSFKKIA